MLSCMIGDSRSGNFPLNPHDLQLPYTMSSRNFMTQGASHGLQRALILDRYRYLHRASFRRMCAASRLRRYHRGETHKERRNDSVDVGRKLRHNQSKLETKHVGSSRAWSCV